MNDAPTVVGETIGGATEDQGLLIMGNALLANDSDVDNAQASLTLSRVQSGTGGTVSLNGAGNVVFVPNANFHGAATFDCRYVFSSYLRSKYLGRRSFLYASANDSAWRHAA